MMREEKQKVSYGRNWLFIFWKHQNKAKQQQETNLDISFSVMWHAQNDSIYFVF